jgi:hypothetical protein
MVFKMDKINLSKTITYNEIIRHRNKCKYWGICFCLKCFGGGLNIFSNELLNELEKKGLIKWK